MSVRGSDTGAAGGSRWRRAAWTAGLAVAWVAIGLGVIRLFYDAPPPHTYPLLASLLLVPVLVLVLWSARDVLLNLPGNVIPYRRSRRYRAHIHREAYIYVLILSVIGLGAFFGRSNLLLLVFGLLAGPWVLGGQVTLLVLNGVRVTRSLPEFAAAGQRFSIRLRLRNRKPLLSAWMVTAVDTVTNGREELHPAVLFARVPPRGEREAQYVVRPGQRGRHRLGPLRIACAFPLGLVERSFEIGEVQELIVCPRIGRLTAQWHADLSRDTQGSERALAQIGPSAEHFHRLREYRGGDTPRAIHWRTTARRNELMVREYQHHQDPEILLVLDLWQPERPTPADLERVELAVSFAATICTEHTQGAGGAAVRLTVSGRELLQLGGDRAPPSLRDLLEHLAVAEAGAALGTADALREAPLPGSGRTRRVLVTTRIDRQSGAWGDPGAVRVVVAEPETLRAYVAWDQADCAVTP